MFRWMVSCAILPALLCGQQAADPAAQRIQMLERELAQQKRTARDWGGLLRYGSDNTELPKLKPGEARVIFFGDQITEMWGENLETYFPGKPWLNRGMAGQATDQMLIRFRQDVISLHPKAVVIEAGLNDIAHGFMSAEMIAETVLDNVVSMTELARANGIKVVLASLTPVCDCFANAPGRKRWQGRISDINRRLQAYAQQAGAEYLNYFSALADNGDLKREFTSDGVIPNEAGYRVMAKLAGQSIEVALKKD